MQPDFQAQMRRIPHDSVYTDRLSERALCYDFPADKAFIDGLHAMQSYFVARGSNIDIPVVRVMNTAHWLVAYLYATSCSGEQLEYDAMTYNSVGRDKQLMYVSLIVLIAMLNRTDGARAKACRSMMLENRTEDFYEGVSLYEQWLDGGLEHYTDEDFLIDIMDEVNLLKQENERLTYENKQLKTRISMKEERQAPVIHVAGNYIDIHDNNHCNIYATEPPKPLDEVEPEKKQAYTPPIPKEGDYNGVREYIEERKKYDEKFRIAWDSHNLKQNCDMLTRELGWLVDDHSLGTNINRHR